MSKRDYYEVLSVGRDAGDAEIKKAYRTLAMKHHPDRNPGDAKAEELFKEASEAYQVLSEPEKRSAYDRFGHEGLRGMGHQGFSSFDDIVSSFGDVFGDLFGGVFSGGRARRDGPRKGRDLAYQLEMTFEEAATGIERELEFERPTECVYCGGSGAKSPDAVRECPSCGGSGQMSYRQGFMTYSTTCSDCGGAGRQILEHCAECDGAGRRLEQRKVKVKIPPGVTRTPDCVFAKREKEAPRVGRRAICSSSSPCSRMRNSNAMGRMWRARCMFRSHRRRWATR